MLSKMMIIMIWLWTGWVKPVEGESSGSGTGTGRERATVWSTLPLSSPPSEVKSSTTSRAASLYWRPSSSWSPRRGICSRLIWREFPRSVMEPSDICRCQHRHSHLWTLLTTERTQTRHLLSPKQVLLLLFHPTTKCANNYLRSVNAWFKLLNIQPVTNAIKVRELREQSQIVNVETKKEVSMIIERAIVRSQTDLMMNNVLMFIHNNPWSVCPQRSDPPKLLNN